jgi:hypothetical protein
MGCARMFPLPTKFLRALSSFILMFAMRLAAYTAGSNGPLLTWTRNNTVNGLLVTEGAAGNFGLTCELLEAVL